ncbi:hypothetical protein E2C01_072212 [Portunus trituberculatus]|uniref:Uncharacterized protein n=1 Tax=Portunus trituberculatus TaxID=210409 RepID=A0A5B7I8C4_PORTR|nr:hypothetical protein [Portunus trituberculatus]
MLISSENIIENHANIALQLSKHPYIKRTRNLIKIEPLKYAVVEMFQISVENINIDRKIMLTSHYNPQNILI